MPVAWSFDVFFDLHLNKRLIKQSWRRWFETQSSSLWRHCNVLVAFQLLVWQPRTDTWNLRVMRIVPVILLPCVKSPKHLVQHFRSLTSEYSKWTSRSLQSVKRLLPKAYDKIRLSTRSVSVRFCWQTHNPCCSCSEDILCCPNRSC